MDADTALDLAERLGRILLAAGLKLVCAESCTGGGLCHAITAVPGSSQWFERGYVVYSDLAKQENLDVSAEILAAHGAVSEETARAMARGALAHSQADLSVAITGIAGPDGGSPDKPVGTVCLAWGRLDGELRSTRVLFPGDRAQVRDQSVLLAMQGLLDMVAAGG